MASMQPVDESMLWPAAQRRKYATATNLWMKVCPDGKWRMKLFHGDMA